MKVNEFFTVLGMEYRDWKKTKEEKQAAQAAELAEYQRRQTVDYYSQNVFRKQLHKALEAIPHHYNIAETGLILDKVTDDNLFIYRVPKLDIAKHTSHALCIEICTLLNEQLKCLSTDADMEMERALCDWRISLSNLYNLHEFHLEKNPENEAKFIKERDVINGKYDTAYYTYNAFLRRIQVVAVESEGNFFSIGVRVIDETVFNRYNPQCIFL